MPSVPRLPGVYFQAEPTPPDAVLPRMDIAAFVGFAAAGPLDVPVAIEDPTRFRELYGGELPLAADAERGQLENAWLAPAVAAFFRNGGRRCWVVRVAGPGTHIHRFALAGLHPAEALRSPPDWADEARAQARSPGSWADGLRVGTVLQRERLFAVANSFAAAVHDYRLDVSAAPPGLRPGDLLEWVFGPGDPVLLFFVDTVTAQARGARLSGHYGFWLLPIFCSSASEEDEPQWPSLTETEGLDFYGAWRAASPTGQSPSVRLLRFEIRVWRSDEPVLRLGDLAFSRAHPRFWANLRSDDELFRQPQGRIAPPPDPALQVLIQETLQPRFPLSGTPTARAVERYLPVAMRDRPEPAHARAPDAGYPDDIAARNGLTRFDPALFIDPALAGVRHGALLREAQYRYYVQELALRGIHSLLPVEEVTLLAIPDAVHREWDRGLPDSDLLAAPVLKRIPDEVDSEGRYRLSWSAVATADAYRLERGTSADLATAATVYLGPDTEALLGLPEDCPRRYYFRVRALRANRPGPWSGTRGRTLPTVDFATCGQRYPGRLRLAVSANTYRDTGNHLIWQRLAEADEDSTGAVAVQTAADPDFLTARPLHCGQPDHCVLGEILDTEAYFRARLQDGDWFGPWSNTVVVPPRARSSRTLQPEDSYRSEGLLAVHRALARFCAARGDLLAVLSLPRHYRRGEVLEHLGELLPGAPGAPDCGVPPLGLAEAPALSYVALYHPWLAAVSAPAGGAVHYTPPDGAVLGSMARRALEQGAWLAPANRPLTGVLALETDFDRAEQSELNAARVNLVLADPRGFLPLNAATLSADRDLGLINIRRLLILLRRLALREGNHVVFEPNDANFRSLVRSRFEVFLSTLYVRGAFAGASPQQAYRVVSDESVNPPVSVEQGRFIVELRVAPARPLAFLTVRLVQTGPAQLLFQET